MLERTGPGPTDILLVRSQFSEPIKRRAVFQAEVYLREVIEGVRSPKDEPALLKDLTGEAFLTEQRLEFGGRSILAAIRYVIQNEQRGNRFIPAAEVPDPDIVVGLRDQDVKPVESEQKTVSNITQIDEVVKEVRPPSFEPLRATGFEESPSFGPTEKEMKPLLIDSKTAPVETKKPATEDGPNLKPSESEKGVVPSIEVESKPRIKKTRVEAGQEQVFKGGVRFAVEEALDKFMAENAGKPVVLAQIAREVGVSRERLRQIYAGIASRREVPPLASRELSVSQVEFDKEVGKLSAQGFNVGEVALNLGVTKRLVTEVKSRVRKRGVKERKEQVRELRRQEYGDKRISEMTGISLRTVTGIINRLNHAGEKVRLRKKPKTKDEIEQLKDRVKQLRLDPRNLSESKIAQITDQKLFDVRYIIRKLLQ